MRTFISSAEIAPYKLGHIWLSPIQRYVWWDNLKAVRGKYWTDSVGP
jgi:hypothetical protein